MYIKELDKYRCGGKVGCGNLFSKDDMDSKLCYCKECKNKYSRKAYKEGGNLTSKKYYNENQSEIVKYQRNLRKVNKEKIIKHYSNNTMECKYCGNSDIRVLSIDHIDGNGCKHRREYNIGSGSPFYKWLIKNNYPEGYQVLCMNCQFIKRYENEEILGE